MMNKALRSAWREFQYIISQIDNRENQITIFKRIKSWYLDNKKLLSSRLIEEYGLEELINIDTAYYPLEKSQCTSKDIKRFLTIQPFSEECLIVWLRDILWELVVLSVDIQCENCGKLEMSALFNVETESVFFECTQCGWIKTINKHPVKSIKTIRLAKNKELKIA
ncbi:MAG: hypothetical protein AAF630_12270, partial [Cyanobacteria bacterium P01_C01_bin.38]